jgi:hypothetical protein
MTYILYVCAKDMQNDFLVTLTILHQRYSLRSLSTANRVGDTCLLETVVSISSTTKRGTMKATKQRFSDWAD